MHRSERRILTTHTGSLIRPASLTLPAGCAPASAAESATALREAVDAIVRKQVEIGLDVVNDGEFGKVGWATYILERLRGIEADTCAKSCSDSSNRLVDKPQILLARLNSWSKSFANEG